MSSKKSKKNIKSIEPRAHWFFNKFVLVFMVFLIWVSFFDNNNLYDQYKMNATIHGLETEIDTYQQNLEIIKQEEKDLADNIEKLAREKYKFGAPNEDIFIIEPKKDK